MAAPWENVKLPQPPDLRPPTVDFSPLSQIPQAYYQGQELQRQQALRTALQDPSLYDPNTGKLDINKGIQKFLNLGDVGQASSLWQLGQRMRPPPAQVASPYDEQPDATSPLQQPQTQPRPVERVPTSNSGVVQAPATPVHDPSLRDDEQISPGQAAAANVPGGGGGASVQPQPMPAGDPRATIVPRPVQTAQAQPQSQPSGAGLTVPADHPGWPASNAAADAKVPVTLRGTYNGPLWRDKLLRAADQITTQATAAANEAVRQGLPVPDMKGALERAAGFRKDAAAIDAELAPTTEQKNILTNAAGTKVAQEGAAHRSETTYSGIGQLAANWERQGGKAINDMTISVLNQPELYTGVGANGILTAEKIRAAFGGNPKAAQYVEALNKLSATDVLSTINAAKYEASEGSPGNSNAGRIFSQQVEQAQKTAVNQESTLAGNRYLAELKKRMGDFSVQVRNMAAQYYKQHGKVDEGFDEKVATYLQKNPLFTEQEIRDPSLLGAVTAPPGLKTAKQLYNYAVSMGLNEKDPIRTSDGTLTHVPLRVTVYPNTPGTR